MRFNVKGMFIAVVITAVAAMFQTGCGPQKVTKETVVVFETNQGIIELALYPDVAPKACDNFFKLVKKGYYDGQIFHRVIRGFMVQTGDPSGTGQGGESASGLEFENEVSPSVTFNRPGLLAMANRGPDTNASQFFITVAARPELNMKYTIFGEVTSGMEAVAAIEGSAVDVNFRPLSEQKINKAYIKGSGMSLGFNGQNAKRPLRVS